MNDDILFDSLSDEYNYINNDLDKKYISEYDKLERFIVNELKNSIPVNNYENMLYREIDINNIGIFDYLEELELLSNQSLKQKKKNKIFIEFYNIIKNSINKFNKKNKEKEKIDNKYIIIPLVNNYIFYIGINCYITNNINELENTSNKIINLYKEINMDIDNYELKEINENFISIPIIDKNNKSELNIVNKKQFEEEIKLRIFILEINFNID